MALKRIPFLLPLLLAGILILPALAGGGQDAMSSPPAATPAPAGNGHTPFDPAQLRPGAPYPGAGYPWTRVSRAAPAGWGPAAPPDGVDLDVTFISRTPKYKSYCVEYLWGAPGEPGIPTLCPGTEGEQRWPAPGEVITFTAHIANKGAQPSPAFAYRWEIDGAEVASGILPGLAAGAMTTTGYQWPWGHVMDGERVTDDHTVRFTVDPLNEIAETYEINNTVADRTNALGFRIAITPEMIAAYDTPWDPAFSYSAEDWLQRQIAAMNWVFANSIYPTTPAGATERVRIDEIVVVSAPPINDRSSDGGWFVDADYRIISAWYDPLTDIDWALVHELSHQVGVIDLYQLDMSVTSVHVLDRNGMPANFGFSWPRPDLMGGGDIAPHTDGHLYSSHGAAGFSSTKGYRRGYYGEYQYDIPTENWLRVLDNRGNPAAGVEVSLYQRNGPAVWPGDITIDNGPEFVGSTGVDGRVRLANRQVIGGPWATATGHVLRDNPFGVVDVVGGRNRFLVKLARGKHEEFAWLDITDFNLAYWRGDREGHTFTLASHVPAEAIPAAPEGLTAQVAQRQVTLRWRGSLIPEVRGYYVYRATRPTYAYERISGLVQGADPIYVTECHGGDCVYTVTALDLDDRESGFSAAAWAPDLILPSAIVITDRGPAPTPMPVTVTAPPSALAGADPRGRPAGQVQDMPLRVILDTHAGPLIRQLLDERYLSRIGSVHVNLTGCRYLAFDPHGEGRFLVSDPKEHKVLVMDAALDSPAFPYWFGEYGTEPNQFRSPAGVAVWDQPCNSDACQRILVADSGNDRIQAFNPYGSFISMYGTTGSGPGQFHDPQGLAVDDLGRVIVVDRGNNRLQLLAFDGQSFSHLKTVTGGFNGPTGVWAYGSDRILVADTGNNVVKELIPDGDSYIVKEHREPLSEPRGVAADRDGNLIVADTGNQQVVTLPGVLPTFTPLPPVTPTTAPTATPTSTPSVTPTPTTTIPGSISGVAWYDRDGDGSRDPGEPSLAGVIIRLSRWETEIAETQTAADGTYRFAPLVPGTLYRVREVQPAWLRWSTTPDEVPIALANGQHAVADFGDWNGRPTWLPLVLR